MKQKAREIGEKIAREGCPENGWHKDLILEFAKEIVEDFAKYLDKIHDGYLTRPTYFKDCEDWWKQKLKE